MPQAHEGTSYLIHVAVRLTDGEVQRDLHEGLLDRRFELAQADACSFVYQVLSLAVILTDFASNDRSRLRKRLDAYFAYAMSRSQ